MNAEEIQESDFIMKIDACFPYKDEIKWKSLIQEGASISANASLMVLHEIVRKPKYIHVSDTTLLEMVDYWKENNKLPLQSEIIEAAKALIQKKVLSKSKARNIFKSLQKYNGLYNAASIILYAANERNREISALYTELIEKWETA